MEVKGSKPIGELKKGDVVKVDGRALEVDSHEMIMDHGTTKEMLLDIFDEKKDEDFQLRYFDDQVETSMEFYKLEGDFMYQRVDAKKVEW